MMYRAKAPLRLGLGGGGTDVPPYVDEYGGRVLNATINKYAYATVVLTDTNELNIHSQDYQQSIRYDLNDNVRLPYDGNLDLIKAVVNAVREMDSIKKLGGCDVYVRTDVPPGVGLGTSSTVIVAVLGALLEAVGARLSLYAIAQKAWEIERHDLKLAGGKQDQYAATFGGVNLMEFHRDGEVIVNTLRLSKTAINELQHNILLCYTGTRHVSHEIIRAQMVLTKKRLNNFEHIKNIAIAMKEDLLTDDLTNFGMLLSTDWYHKKQLSDKVSNDTIDTLGLKAIESGAEGLKLTGAGGGGVLIVYCDWFKKPEIAKVMRENGCQIIDFTITKTGLETWTV